MIKIYFQTNEEDCGWACVANILSLYKSNVDLAYLKLNSKIKKVELSAYDMLKILANYKIDAEGFEVEIDYFRKNNICRPMIVQIQKSGTFHFIVVSKKTHDQINIIDPAIGRYTLSNEEFEKIFTSIIIITKKNKQYVPQIHKTPLPYKEILSLISLKKLTYLMILTIVISLSEFISVYILKIIVDKVIPNHRLDILYMILIVGGILFLLSNLLLYIKNNIAFNVSQKVSQDIFSKFIENIMKQKLNFFKIHSIGDFTNRLTDITEISSNFMYLITNSLINILLIIIFTIAISINSPLFVVIILLSFLLYTLIIKLFNRKYSFFYNDSREQLSIFGNSYIATITNIFSIKTFSNVSLSLKMLQENYIQANNKNKLAFIHQNKQLVYLNLSKNFFEIAMYIYGCFCVINHEITLGTFVLITTLVQYLNSSFESINQIQTMFQKLKVSIDRIYNFTTNNQNGLGLKSQYSELPTINNLKFIKSSLSIDGSEIYNNINLEFNFIDYDTIGFSGASGVGKSMLMGTLVNLYQLTNGSILINNIPLSSFNNNSIRKEIMLLNQDPQIFPGYKFTLERNEAFKYFSALLSKFGLTDELNISRKAQIENLISSNSKLSGGQKQRLYICMALTLKPKLLILDETLSGLNKKWIDKFFDIVSDNKIKCVIVSHDSEILSKTDKKININ